ncbi:aminotransferase [Verticillium alfalfae VaMs.102]|uniref:Aminotransferase n=1 Tax=Verticillium alfalfae (strain VaMs.102 / ATCC MYA-4576 / FGSC 10136) TaxID=526221 RepID=C9STQ7_VERA1|nr:aminotransferase [Verticillium alfalfae VaMs.102]EEY22218.1 aminotransferase [Verticillium alfalfae VaMs.102]
MVTRTPHLINLLRGWPSPSLLPAAALTAAAARALSDPTISVPGLQYAPDPGFQPLREDLAAWLGPVYGAAPEADRICITGGPGRTLAKIPPQFQKPRIVAPGVRTGWVAATPAFAYGLSQTGASCSGGAPSQLAAVMVWELLRSGELERRLVEESIPQLRERHRRVLEAVEALLVPLGVAVRRSSLAGAEVYGGYFVWLTLPEGVRGADVANRGKELGVTVGAGEKFEVAGDEDGARFEREVRICFSWEELEDVVEGVRRLSHAVRDVQQGKSVAGPKVDATYIEK